MEGLQPGLDVTFQGGARARNLPGLVTNIDLTPFQTIAVWVGGNDAHPRKGLLNEAQFSKDITDFLTYLSSNSPDARLILMTASRRASPAPYGNISKINSLLQGVATKNKVEICNIFRVLDRSKELPTPCLEKDGVHLKRAAKSVVAKTLANHIRCHNRKPILAPKTKKKKKNQ